MRQSNQGQEMVDLMNTVEEVDLSEESMLQVTNSKGPGTSKQKSPNDYKPADVKKMVSYVMKYVKAGKAPKSFKGDYQSFLNSVGKGMEQFKKIKLGNPEYKEGTMKGDMMNMSYKPNKYDRGTTGSKPGSIRGKELGKDIY